MCQEEEEGDEFIKIYDVQKSKKEKERSVVIIIFRINR